VLEKPGFFREGFREIGRKVNRRKLRKQLVGLDRQRNEALAGLGRRAWAAKVDLSAFVDLREQLGGLEARVGELSTRAKTLEEERVALQARRQGEVARFDEQRRPVEEKKREVDAALRAARHRLSEQDQTVKRLQARQAVLAAEMAKLEQRQVSPPAGSVPAPDAPASADQIKQQQVLSDQRQLLEEVALANSALPPLASEVSRLNAESQRYADELARIEAGRSAALSPLDADLNRVQQEFRRATQEASALQREQAEHFTRLGAALYDRKLAEPVLAENTQAIAAIDRSRAATQAALEASLALTRAMPQGTLLKFSAVLILTVALIAGVAYGIHALRVPSGPAFAPHRGPNLEQVSHEESQKDAVVDAFIHLRRDQSTKDGEKLRQDGVETLKDDLTTLGSSGDPTYLPRLARILKSDEPKLRAAAAGAMGRIRPTAAEVPALIHALNDPVGAVRAEALGALDEIKQDPAAHLLVQRARLSLAMRGQEPKDTLQPEAVPDAKRLGVPVYGGATFLYYASDLSDGRASFSTQDPVTKVLDFYKAKTGRLAMSGEEFTRAYFGGTPADPTGAKRIEQENKDWFNQVIQSGKPSAEIQTELEKRAARVNDLPLIRYGFEEIYGSPSFIALEESGGNGPKRALRFVVVFEDRALARTGFDLRLEPEAMPK
jgi:hypothetical protein